MVYQKFKYFSIKKGIDICYRSLYIWFSIFDNNIV